MKKLLIVVLAFASSYAVNAQSSKMVTWNYAVKKVADKSYEVVMTANIAANYHMYALNAGVDGPVATTFTFTKSPAITLTGVPKEQGSVIKKFEPAWNGTANYFEGKVNFVQAAKVKFANVKPELKGQVEFMVCDDTKCLLPSKVDFKVNLGG